MAAGDHSLFPVHEVRGFRGNKEVSGVDLRVDHAEAVCREEGAVLFSKANDALMVIEEHAALPREGVIRVAADQRETLGGDGCNRVLLRQQIRAGGRAWMRAKICAARSQSRS